MHFRTGQMLVMPLQSKLQGARERATYLRQRAARRQDDVDRDLRQAAFIEAKGLGYDNQTPEEKLARANSWNSHLRRTAVEARRVGKWMKVPSLYADLMKLLRYIKRRLDAGADDVPVESMQKHLKRSARHVYTLLGLLRGLHVKKGRRFLEPVRNADGSPLLFVCNGGRRSNRYRLHKPPVTMDDLHDEAA